MSRSTYVLRNGELVEKHLAAPLTPRAHSVISDTMDDTWHPATGRLMDSKSGFRRVTKSHGYEEVGTSKTWASSRPEIPDAAYRDSVERAMSEVEQGRRSNPRTAQDYIDRAIAEVPRAEREAIARSFYEARN